MLNGQLRQHRDDEEVLRHQMATLQNERKLDKEDAQNTAQVHKFHSAFAQGRKFQNSLEIVTPEPAIEPIMNYLPLNSLELYEIILQ